MRRRWSSTRRRVYRGYKRGRERLTRGYKGVEKAPHWRRTPKKTAATVVTGIGAALLVLLVVRSLWISVFVGKPRGLPFGFNPDEACGDTDYSCGVTSGIGMTFLSLAFAGAVFFLYRLGRLRWPFVRQARDEPKRLVETAGTIIGSVVGRDELCNVIIDDLKERRDRRPHIVIGGVGVGKTALLVELTRTLAEHGAVPVPIRLREARTELDFESLARKRFISVVGRSAHSDAETERAWRELRKDDQVVVLADGLEEALSERGGAGADTTERDNKIRTAIRAAQQARLPLVIASRPHDAIAGVDAAIVELEPLGEEHALEYIEKGASSFDEHRLDWVIETANVTEAPIYLQLAQELNAKGLLAYAKPETDDEDDVLDTRGDDRVALRVRLLETWQRAVEYGHFHAELPMSRDLRRSTIRQLGVLACAGLKHDTLEVGFSQLFAEAPTDREYRQRAIVSEAHAALRRLGLQARTGEADDTIDDTLRRAIKAQLTDAAAAPGADAADPSAALTGALVSKCRDLADDGCFADDGAPPDEALERELRPAVERGLARAAEREARPALGRKRYLHYELVKRLEDAIRRLYQTDEFRDRQRSDVADAVERELKLAVTRGVRLGLVEARGDGVRFPHSIMQAYLGSLVVDGIVEEWTAEADLKTALQRSGRELLAALVMASRLAPASNGSRRSRTRRFAANTHADSGGVRAALSEEAEFGQHGGGKRIDLIVAALEIDVVVDAGDVRHRGYAEQLVRIWPEKNEDRTVEEAKLGALTRVGEVMRTLGERHSEEKGDRLRPHYAALYEIACKDVWYPARLAAAQQIGRGGDRAIESLISRLGTGEAKPSLLRTLGPFLPPDAPSSATEPEAAPSQYDDDDWKDERKHRELVLRAWLAPLLVSSAKERVSAARDNLENWLRYVPAASGSDHGLPIAFEIALAQGFKHAANRRPGRSRVSAQTRGYLAEQAASMLERARFWFSRLTLVQALCLWALRDPELPAPQQRPRFDGDEPRGRERRRPRPPARRGSDPAALIDHWLASSAGSREHPFVDEARKLAAMALEKNQPERYIWIDESGVVTKIGSRPPYAGARRKHNLWIPPSIGWVALDPRAQRLVADVLILLNLAERGGDPPSEREKRLRRAMRDDLPACLQGERQYLEADSTVGMVYQPAPGANCKDGCAFDLCPYPPKGISQTYRVELSEAFCRRQRVLIGPWFRPFPRRTARWQGAVPRELSAFWKAMETRARL